ncbi:hypothetical protein Fmac_031927 [Flemingia macrophylla]|uniref:Uncharacterized protein n=1 Tax=Flemingia macrophylla TaxID=520843 RepID=A0ABD1L3G6_9FABA
MNPMEPTLSHNFCHDHEWVINISRSLEGDTEDNEELFSTRIFNVPKSLLSSKKEAYTPQIIALGPYHHRRPELLDTERHKLDAAKKIQNKLKPLKFIDFVTNTVAQNDNHIRSSYNRFLNLDQETLAWMLAIDTSFLLLYLKTYPSDRRRLQRSVSLSRRNSFKIGHFVGCSRRNTWHQMVIRDIIMLENQIPLFLLRELYNLCYPEDDKNEGLSSTLVSFCKDLAPVKHIDEERFKEECFTSAHLLELLYHTVCAHCHHQVEDISINIVDQEQEKENMDQNDRDVGRFKSAINSIVLFIRFLVGATMQLLSKILTCKLALQLIKVVLNIRGKSAISDAVLSAGDVVEEANSAVAQAQAQQGESEGLSVEEIAIPSVEELTKIGVTFRPTNGGLSTVKFDASSATFHLPVVHLNENSDVVLRNLVAYEACVAPEGMVLTRYTELMNGIIDTEEDVRILRESGVVVNRLKSDREAASMFNGMTLSVKVTNVPVLDRAIESVNGYYDGSWKVKVKGGMKKYVYASWPCLTFLAANLIICLTAVEALCSLYTCSKWMAAF